MKVIQGIFKVITGVVLTALIVLVIAIVGVRAVGITPYIVLSGSMEPTYKTGGIVYTVKVDPADLKVGDNITFTLSGGTVATHQIVRVETSENGELQFRTMGINNKDEQGNPLEDAAPVLAKNVLGKGVFHLPYLGYLADYIQHPPGTYVAIAVGAGVAMLLLLPDLLFGEDDKKKKKAIPEEATAPQEDEGAPKE